MGEVEARGSSRQQIFISYGREDAAEFAENLADYLESTGSYQVWLDRKRGIPVGAPFDVRIEIGIRESALLVAVLTEWSIRDEAFCRNELLYAQAHKKLIVPVRVHDVVPPIQIVSLNYVDAVVDRANVNQQLLDAIDTALKTKSSVRLQLPPPQLEQHRWWADGPGLNFETELARYGGSFVGREWLIARLRTWIDGGSSRLLLLTADAGVGKSALAAQLSARLPVRSVYFCTRDDEASCRVPGWIRTLVYQLAAAELWYREFIETIPEPDWTKPLKLFKTLILEPIRERAPNGTHGVPMVFVIDGLDESQAVAGQELVTLLADEADRLPAWLRVIATSRPDQNLLAAMSREGIEHLHLHTGASSGDTAESQLVRGELQSDLDTYIASRLADMPDTSVGESERAALAEQINAAANGNILFAKMTLDSLSDPIASYRLSPASIGRLPRKLGGLYHQMFRLRFSDAQEYANTIVPLLNGLVASMAPLPESLLQRASLMDHAAAELGVSRLSQFLGIDETDPRIVRLFHKSLADWLTTPSASGDFAASEKAGHRQLANACWAEWEESAPTTREYIRQHLAAHLVADRQWERLLKLIKADRKFWLPVRAALRRIYKKFNEWPEGLKKFLDADSEPRAILFRGETLEMEQRLDEAAAVYRSHCDRVTDPQEGEIYFAVRVALAVVQDRMQPPQSEAALVIVDSMLEYPSFEQDYPKSYWRTRYQRGVILSRLRRDQEAIEALQLVEEQPEYDDLATSAIYQRGVVELNQQRYDDAENTFRTSLQRRGNDPFDHRRAFEHHRLGNVCAATGRTEEARRYYEESLRISDNCGDHRYARKTRIDLEQLRSDSIESSN